MFDRLQTAHRVVAQVLDPADEMRDLARDTRDVPLGLDHVEPGPREGARRVRRRRVVDLVQVAVVRRPPAVSRLRCKLEVRWILQVEFGPWETFLYVFSVQSYGSAYDTS